MITSVAEQTTNVAISLLLPRHAATSHIGFFELVGRSLVAAIASKEQQADTAHSQHRG
jgi:hypothetical protein